MMKAYGTANPLFVFAADLPEATFFLLRTIHEAHARLVHPGYLKMGESFAEVAQSLYDRNQVAVLLIPRQSFGIVALYEQAEALHAFIRSTGYRPEVLDIPEWTDICSHKAMVNYIYDMRNRGVVDLRVHLTLPIGVVVPPVGFVPEG